MNEELAGLIREVEIAVEGLAERFDVPIFYFTNSMDDLKEYLATKDITDPQRKCTDKTHHFKGCDCW